MAAGDRKYFSKQLVALLVGAALCSYFGSAPASFGQASAPEQNIEKKIPEGAKLLLSANELVYNRDADLVSAVGGVQIN
ncbi:LPS-assembly protein LptD, partial [Rhizobium ruizarguesonis]